MLTRKPWQQKKAAEPRNEGRDVALECTQINKQIDETFVDQ